MRSLLAAAALLLLIPTPADAARWRPLGVFAGPVATDGARLAVVQPHPEGEILVWERGRRRTVAIPRQCRFRGVTGSGRAALACRESLPYAAERTAVVDLRSGALSIFTRFDDVLLSGADGWQVTDVGRRWLAATVTGYHWSRREIVSPPATWRREPDSPRITTALDLRSGSRRLCSPLRRPRNEADEFMRDWTWDPVRYDGRRMVFGRGGHLWQWRCGDRGPRRLLVCRYPRGCDDQQLGGGRLTVRRGAAAYVSRAAGAPLRRVSLRGIPSRTGRALRLAHTSREMFVSVEDGDAWRAYVAIR